MVIWANGELKSGMAPLPEPLRNRGGMSTLPEFSIGLSRTCFKLLVDVDGKAFNRKGREERKENIYLLRPGFFAG